MRVLKAILAVAVVLGLAGAASAQSLGELADQQKQKRQGKPAPKVITENDLSRAGKKGTLSMSGAPAETPSAEAAAAPEAATAEAAPPAEATPETTEAPEAPEGAPAPEPKAPEPVKPKGPPPKSEEELRAEAKANQQKMLDAARTNLAQHQQMLDKVVAGLNESATSGGYSQVRGELFKKQEEEKAAVAKFQAEVTQLEEAIRRSAWPR